jgi:carbon-monoxide dehydrogenase medium subunit
MKPVAFAYARPTSVVEAVGMLAAEPHARVLAGGQTLGPMLNLRLAQPALLIDITRIPELAAVSADAVATTIGATVTHAAIEDGRVPDPTGGFLARVARGIAYRAVRTRGTLGGSLAHADPAADWLSCLSALGAQVSICGTSGIRSMALDGFVRGAMETALARDELLTAVHVPRFSPAARFGFHKICRKTGELAEAIGVVAYDPENAFYCAVSGATSERPLIIQMRAGSSGPKAFTVAEAQRMLEARHFAGDAYELKLHAVALRRASEVAFAP